MAVKGQEVEGIKGGIEAASSVKGAFNQNMLFRRMSVETREGFGQVVELDTTMNAITWRGYSGANYKNITPDPSQLWGYKNHLGSYLMTTGFGHRQVVSVFSADVNTGDRQLEPLPKETEPPPVGSGPSSIGEFTSIYLVSIYDLSTGQRWEEPIYKHTASFSKDGSFEMPDWRGTYESSFEQKYEYSTTFPGKWIGGQFCVLADQQKWISAPEPDEPFFFTELDDVLYFGNRHTGLLAYFPAKFRSKWRGNGETNSAGTMRRDRSRQTETVVPLTGRGIYSESSVVIDAVAADGAFSAGFTYLDKTTFPKPVGATSVDGRLVLFESNNVYFSDVLYPTSVVPENVLFVPSEEPITAIAEHTGNLMVFTENEIWYYRPSAGFVVTEGSLIKLSSGVGCVSQNSIVKASGSLFWMDKRGCYTIGSSLSVDKLSEPIEPFFNDYITNPITSYYTLLGNVPAGDLPEQGAIRMAFNPSMMSATYFHKLECILFCMPHLGGALYMGVGGEWGWWSFESNVLQSYDSGTGTFTNTVGVAKNIHQPWVMADVDDLFVVGSYPGSRGGERVNQKGHEDAQDDRQTVSRPYSILRYGRGGAVDRSVEYGEDQRSLAGNWRSIDEGSGAGLPPQDSAHYIYFGKPIPIPAMTRIGTVGGTLSEAVPKGSFWLPVGITAGNINNANNQTHYYVHNLNIVFTFASTYWETIPAAAGNTLQPPLFFLPPERQRAEPAWSVTKSTTAAAGDTVTITFNGAAAASNLQLFGSGVLNVNKRQMNRLIYIPFRPIKSGGEYKAYQGIGMSIVTKNVQAITGAGPTLDPAVACRAYIWEETFLGEAEKGNNHQAVYTGTSSDPDRLLVAQPVDWAYKTRPVADPDKVQIKGRGLRIIGISRGAGAHRLTEGWPMGLLNTLSGADYKEWSSQVVDLIPKDNAVNTSGEYPAVVSSANKQTLRTRFKDSSTGTLVHNAFNRADGPKWGTAGGTAASYSYVIDEEETSLLSISDGIRGQSVSYMLWGHIQNKAEKIALYSAKIILRALGGTRRKGR